VAPERLERGEAADAADEVLLRAAHVEAARRALGDPVEGLQNLARADAVLHQLVGQQHHLDLLDRAADGHDLRDAGQAQQAPAHHPLGGVAQRDVVDLVRAHHADEHDLAHDRRGRRQHRLDARRAARRARPRASRPPPGEPARGSTCQSNSTQMSEMPMAEDERRRRTPEAPLSVCSSGTVTSCSTSSGARPLASVTTVTEGADSSGSTSSGICEAR
jgi:hypothetical protein